MKLLKLHSTSTHSIGTLHLRIKLVLFNIKEKVSLSANMETMYLGTLYNKTRFIDSLTNIFMIKYFTNDCCLPTSQIMITTHLTRNSLLHSPTFSKAKSLLHFLQRFSHSKLHLDSHKLPPSYPLYFSVDLRTRRPHRVWSGTLGVCSTYNITLFTEPSMFGKML